MQVQRSMTTASTDNRDEVFGLATQGNIVLEISDGTENEYRMDAKNRTRLEFVPDGTGPAAALEALRVLAAALITTGYADEVADVVNRLQAQCR